MMKTINKIIEENLLYHKVNYKKFKTLIKNINFQILRIPIILLMINYAKFLTEKIRKRSQQTRFKF